MNEFALRHQYKYWEMIYKFVYISQELYDATIVMREKKLDLEEAIQEEKKIIDSLKKEVDALIKKNKVISHGVKGAKNDLEAFQLENHNGIESRWTIRYTKMLEVQGLSKALKSNVT